MVERAFSVDEVADVEGLSRPGVLWWITERGVDCMKTGTGRMFFTQQQLDDFRKLRATALQRRRARREQISEETK